MRMALAAQVEGGVPSMGVLIDNRPCRARAGAARKRAAPLRNNRVVSTALLFWTIFLTPWNMAAEE